ncbi:mobilization protein [Aureimonas pseudogalii]|uniref:Mobilization protein n=1 Tax=Aureimonas pseudogalii TaxID=1744844 RepID=A0A7W6H7V5_9HYPH|nr:mobilization protein [Aureimonas pseudogalii]MBB4000250.1 hypothetical protein [Aureimonas pseudogalii]
MAKLSIEERIAQLEARKRALKARLTKHDRAKDTRRKVLLGALVLQQLEGNRDAEFRQRLASWLKGELPGFLTREEDRNLFPEFITRTVNTSGDGSGGSAPASSDPETPSASDENGREGSSGSDDGHGSHSN